MSKTGILLVLVISSLSLAKVPIIFDTDMGLDCDDAGALAILHALEDKGECEILASMISIRGECGKWGVSCVDAINTYYGHPDIPIGQTTSGRIASIDWEGSFVKQIAHEFPQDIGVGGAWNAAKLYRKILSEQSDKSVNIVVTGMTSCVGDLFNTEGDTYSSLNGIDLVEKKVNAIYIMGPSFKEVGRWRKNWNFKCDPQAAAHVLANSKTPIKFGEGGLGHRHKIGRGLIESPLSNPVRRSYLLYMGKQGETKIKDHHCADPTTAYYAVRDTLHFNEVNVGHCEVRESDGAARWMSSPDKNEYYNTPKIPVDELEAIMEDLLVQQPKASPTSNGCIKPYEHNPMYWQYKGEPILLFGGSNRDNIFQWANEGTKLTDHLDLLQSCGGNYIRSAMNSREYFSSGYRWDVLDYPYAQVDGKYDLTQWNDAYWDKLRTLLAETKKRGIIVQQEFWDRWNESGDSIRKMLGWSASPWNPDNNVTYDWSDTPLLKPGYVGFYNAFHMAAVEKDPVLLPVQQRFVKKILDVVIDNGFDHVLFQIDNESGIGDDSLEPDPYWAQYIRDYAKTKDIDYEVYVCTSRRLHWPARKFTEFQDWSNPEVRVPIVNTAFNYCDIAQNNGHSGQLQYDNILWYHAKVREYGVRPVNNMKSYYFNWPIGFTWNEHYAGTPEETGARFWRVVFGSCASIRFHRSTAFATDGNLEGFGLDPQGQVYIRSMRMFADSIHIFSMKPHNDLLSQRVDDEAYCLAEPGKQYAVFFTGAGDRTVGIELPSDPKPFTLRWLNIAESKWEAASSAPQARTVILTPPGAGHWVCILTGN